MTLPEAIVYLLASSNHGMKTDQIARMVNEKGLYKRWDGKPVDGRPGGWTTGLCSGYGPSGYVREE